MIKYDQLFKRTTTGAIQTWWIECEDNKYRTHSGQVDGAIVVSEWTRCVGKNVGRSNETTPTEQCALEVGALYVKKSKEGYERTAKDAAASKRFSPMLAKKFEDYEDEIFLWDVSAAGGARVWSQPKLDGIRCIATAQGLWSRQGNRIVAVPHIEKALEPIFAQHPSIMLDGELYNHELADNFNAIVSAVKKTKPTAEDIELSRGVIEYHMYDVPGWSDDYADRIGVLCDIAEGIGQPLIAVPTFPASDRANLDEHYEEFLGAGYEGQMIRINGPYEQKRSKLLLKRKEFLDAEFEVIDIVEGQGNRTGMAGFAVLRLKNDATFKANVKGDREYLRRVLARRAELIGKKATVEYFKPTPDGVPRFPRIKAFHETGRW